MGLCIKINFLKTTPAAALQTIDLHLAGKGISLNSKVLAGLQAQSRAHHTEAAGEDQFERLASSRLTWKIREIMYTHCLLS